LYNRLKTKQEVEMADNKHPDLAKDLEQGTRKGVLWGDWMLEEDAKKPKPKLLPIVVEERHGSEEERTVKMSVKEEFLERRMRQRW